MKFTVWFPAITPLMSYRKQFELAFLVGESDRAFSAGGVKLDNSISAGLAILHDLSVTSVSGGRSDFELQATDEKQSVITQSVRIVVGMGRVPATRQKAIQTSKPITLAAAMLYCRNYGEDYHKLDQCISLLENTTHHDASRIESEKIAFREN